VELATKRWVAVIVVKTKRNGIRQFGMAVVLVVSAALSAHAQDTLSIGAQSALPTFQLTSNPTSTSNLVVLTNWNFTTTNSAHLSVCVYMAAPMTGTGNNTDAIPASAVQVNGSSIITGGTSCGVATAFPVVTGSHIWINGGTPSTRIWNGNRQDTLGISISGYPANLESDTYTGTINLIASVQ
jgi:hypothetical protein